jgi:ankyrin repeat protein
MDKLEEQLSKVSIATAKVVAVEDINPPTEAEITSVVPAFASDMVSASATDICCNDSNEKTGTKAKIADINLVQDAIITISPPDEIMPQKATQQPITSQDGKPVQPQEDVTNTQDKKLVETLKDGETTSLSTLIQPVPEGNLVGATVTSMDTVEFSTDVNQANLNKPEIERTRSRSPRGRKRVPLEISSDSIFSAIAAGDNVILLRVLQSGASISHTAPDGTTPLQEAVIRNREEIVLTLLFFRADPNAGGGYYGSPLVAAINYNRPRLVKVLLEAGADPSQPAVLCAAALIGVEMLELCLTKYEGFEYSIDINAFFTGPTGLNGDTPLIAACRTKKIEVIRFLLGQAKADASVMFTGRCVPEHRSALHAAIWSRDMPTILLILSHLEDPNICNISTRDHPGLLHISISCGSSDILKLLIDRGVDVDKSFPFCGTALHEACRIGSLEMVNILLEAGANPNTNLPDTSLRTEIRNPIHLAARIGSVPVFDALISHGANLQVGTLWIAARYGWIDFMKRLLQFDNIDVDELGSLDELGANTRGTALHGAAVAGNIQALSLLLDEGADPNVKTQYLGTPLDVAIRYKREDCVKELLGT